MLQSSRLSSEMEFSNLSCGPKLALSLKMIWIFLVVRLNEKKATFNSLTLISIGKSKFLITIILKFQYLITINYLLKIRELY